MVFIMQQAVLHNTFIVCLNRTMKIGPCLLKKEYNMELTINNTDETMAHITNYMKEES